MTDTAGNGPDPAHQRPADVDDQTVAALGKLAEALETTEVARGHLYAFHQLTGAAENTLEEAIGMLRTGGHHDLADRLAQDLFGRNVIHDRWTFQIIEDYDDGYHATFQRLEREARSDLCSGRRHLYEAEMKVRHRNGSTWLPG